MNSFPVSFKIFYWKNSDPKSETERDFVSFFSCNILLFKFPFWDISAIVIHLYVLLIIMELFQFALLIELINFL